MTKPANSQEQVQPSARDSIRAAMDEHREQEEKVDAKVEKEEEVKEDKKSSVKEDEKVEEVKEEKEPEEKEEKEIKEEKEEKEVKEDKEEKEEKVSAPAKVKGSQPIPYGLTKEIRAKWQEYDDETQQFITKSVKDANDAKAAAGRVSPELREVDAVLAPYKPSIAQAGTTAAKVVKRVLEYTDGLAGPNKYQMLQQIANDFNIDLTRYGKPSRQPTQLDPNNQLTDATEEVTIDLPPEVHQKLDSILSRFDEQSVSQQEAQKAAKQKAAEDTVHAWSGLNAATGMHDKKPYFPYVRQTMTALMQANPNQYLTQQGGIDLDKAYDDACYADPEIRELMVENAKLAKAAEDRKKKEKKDKDLAAAKAKGLSLKPSAGSLGSSQSKQLANGQSRKNEPVSVRQSLMAAIQENR